MMVDDETVRQHVDRFMLERFIMATQVTTRKLRSYVAQAENREVARHLSTMAEANDHAKKRLEAMLPRVEDA